MKTILPFPVLELPHFYKKATKTTALYIAISKSPTS